ncbi:conserved Plasmodium protein, unknown function [Plasmodium vivax]|uniref:VIR protein n=6 Tax=Plasmodium vivax TaxID=5855 RepID=A5KA43_PLAVS|nr:hypothetical protein, conserved [Plasmodium vivax]KMZ83093.1 hypothetical protein PVIIG_03975 [Plasmodium vivax India VII]KMZ89423.1 hypothetical protein PVBG_03144 [Plasmodium vivax Brazil I]KMZ95786.1 hypothetical protein PVMG_03860 [Plasmodium vivax Mauritania I]KNA02582.1 hypothetical protein PVNG_05781 [Plasmodium vivax North Korean]EDL43679.1 hypothetical protein, conserved [Plasmodium vivax]|eukprot:XP_001613406.1 hypothetical protein [Plasmodium vivax Sal-1]
MNYTIKCLLFGVLLNAACKIDVLCLEGNGINNNYQSPSENYHNDMSIFAERSDNKGCTGDIEQRLINGEKFLSQNYQSENPENLKDYISLKTNQFREYIMHLFKSNSVASNDFYKVLFDCAKVSSAKPYLIDICVNKYLKKHNIDFSPTCLSCFSSFIGCSFISCNKQCAKDQCNDECKSCSEKNCFRTLLNCTKLDALPDPCK